jgi:hypothetical protein
MADSAPGSVARELVARSSGLAGCPRESKWRRAFTPGSRVRGRREDLLGIPHPVLGVPDEGFEPGVGRALRRDQPPLARYRSGDRIA